MKTTWIQKPVDLSKIGDFDINVAIKLYNAADKIKHENKIFKNHLVLKNAEKNEGFEITKDASLILSFLFDYFGFWSRKTNGNIFSISMDEINETLFAIHNFLLIFTEQKNPK